MRIPTTAGLVEASALGPTLGHEHLRSMQETPLVQFPHLYDGEAALRKHLEDVSALAPHGIETICDPSCADLGRDVRVNMEVTAQTGVRFVMATGIYQRGDLIPEYFRHRDVSALVDAFEHDLRVGIQGTSVRAAFIKTAVDEPGMTPGIELVHRAAARASLSTGAPIMSHTNALLRTGLDVIGIFREEGVPLDRVQLAHIGDTEDVDYAEALINAGCYIGMDRYGIDRRLTADRRNACVLELWRRGHASKMILSHDWASTVDVFEPAVLARDYPNWSWSYIFEAALPEFRRAGMPEPEIQQMIGENNHRWLSSEP